MYVFMSTVIGQGECSNQIMTCVLDGRFYDNSRKCCIDTVLHANDDVLPVLIKTLFFSLFSDHQSVT